MAEAVQIRVNDKEFQKTIRDYSKLTRRTKKVIVDTKAFYIARRACKETFRPAKEDIQKGIGQLIHGMTMGKSGKGHRTLTKSGLFTTTAGGYYFSAKGVPIAALIVNELRGKRGEKGFYGEQMKVAIRRLVTSRFSAIAYLASGWIPAIKKLAPLAELKSKAAPPDASANKIKNPQGSVQVATETGGVTIAKIINSAVSKYSTTKDPMTKVAAPALQRAIDFETSSMKQYMEDKYKEAAHQAGIRTN